MAEISYPSAAVVGGIDLVATMPGRISHAIPATGGEVIVDRGISRWGGTVRINEVETGAGARAIEAWLAQMAAHENFSEIPLGSRASDFTATTIASVADSVVVLTAIPSGLAVNDFVRSGNRLFIVTSLVASTRQATLWPDRVVAAGAAFAKAATIRARLSGKPVGSRSGRGFVGPWSLPIREAT